MDRQVARWDILDATRQGVCTVFWAGVYPIGYHQAWYKQTLVTHKEWLVKAEACAHVEGKDFACQDFPGGVQGEHRARDFH